MAHVIRRHAIDRLLQQKAAGLDRAGAVRLLQQLGTLEAVPGPNMRWTVDNRQRRRSRGVESCGGVRAMVTMIEAKCLLKWRGHRGSVRLFAIIAVLALAADELIRTAWISDDAAITLRTVLNFINGYGARFNVDERVQAYTHPLWFLLLSTGTVISQNVFAVSFALSIVLSLIALWLILTRTAVTLWQGVIGCLMLMCSKAYVDFSTSGLENPLAHVLAALTILAARRHERTGLWRVAMWVWLYGCLLYLTRSDLVLFSTLAHAIR